MDAVFFIWFCDKFWVSLKKFEYICGFVKGKLWRIEICFLIFFTFRAKNRYERPPYQNNKQISQSEQASTFGIYKNTRPLLFDPIFLPLEINVILRNHMENRMDGRVSQLVGSWCSGCRRNIVLKPPEQGPRMLGLCQGSCYQIVEKCPYFKS